MQPDRPASSSAQDEDVATRASPVSEVAVLRARCRRQRLAIDRLRAAVSVLRAGAGALKAENADLRRENDHLRDGRDAEPGVGVHRHDPWRAEARLPFDVWAPAAARMLVADCLGAHVSSLTIERAQLVVSELVSNSLRHAGEPAGGEIVVRVRLEEALCRLEVQDAGCEGEVAPRAPDLEAGGGLGLNIVHALSERWGVERAADSGTRVWACIPQAATRSVRRLHEVAAVTADV